MTENLQKDVAMEYHGRQYERCPVTFYSQNLDKSLNCNMHMCDFLVFWREQKLKYFELKAPFDFMPPSEQIDELHIRLPIPSDKFDYAQVLFGGNKSSKKFGSLNWGFVGFKKWRRKLYEETTYHISAETAFEALYWFNVIIDYLTMGKGELADFLCDYLGHPWFMNDDSVDIPIDQFLRWIEDDKSWRFLHKNYELYRRGSDRLAANIFFFDLGAVIIYKQHIYYAHWTSELDDVPCMECLRRINLRCNLRSDGDGFCPELTDNDKNYPRIAKYEKVGWFFAKFNKPYFWFGDNRVKRLIVYHQENNGRDDAILKFQFCAQIANNVHLLRKEIRSDFKGLFELLFRIDDYLPPP